MNEIEDAEYEDTVRESAMAETPVHTSLSVVPAHTNPTEQIIHSPITAAQAKTDAVAALTLSAYSRAAMLEIATEESSALLADFPDEAFKPGAAGKENLIYIEHAFLRDRFTTVFGMGKWAIIPRNRWAEPFMTKEWPNRPAQEGSRVYVEAMLIIRGCFVGEAVGAMEYYPSNAAQNYGDAVEGAKTAAFRRCAKEFGVGLQAWKKDWCAGWWARKNSVNRQHPESRPEPTATPFASTPPYPAPSAAPPAAPKAKAKKGTMTKATSGTRAWALDLLGCQEEGPKKNHLHSYLVALGWLENDKVVEQWPYRFIFLSPDEHSSFQACLSKYNVTGIAELPYPPHGLDPGTLQAHPVSPPAAEPSWRSFIMPFGRKGVALGKLPAAELESYIKDFQVMETHDVGGVVTPFPAEMIAAQKALRDALDEAKETTKG